MAYKKFYKNTPVRMRAKLFCLLNLRVDIFVFYKQLNLTCKTEIYSKDARWLIRLSILGWVVKSSIIFSVVLNLTVFWRISKSSLLSIVPERSWSN